MKKFMPNEVDSLVERGVVIIDVRQPEEFNSGHIENAINIPVGEIAKPENISKFVEPIYINCRTGARGETAYMILKSLGKEEVYNLEGGILAYENLK